MERPRLIVKKLSNGLGRRKPSKDMLTGAVMNAVATSKMQLGEIYTLKSISEIEALGLNAEYDITNKVLVYERLRRLFVHNESITVYFMPVAQTVTLAQMADKEKPYLSKLLKDKAGKIVQAFIARNPTANYSPTISKGLDKDSIDAMYKAQALLDAEFGKDRYCEVFVEGRSFSGSTSAVVNCRELTNACPDVSLVVMADNDVSKRLPIYNGYAAVEDFTAMVSLAAVSQNAGELIEPFNLTKVAEGVFINAGLSSGEHINHYSDTELDTLDEKGLVFATSVSGMAGFWINDTHTCAKIDSDFAYVENNRSIKKAIKLARLALLPRVKSRLKVDEDTGYIAPEVVKDLETTVKTSLDPMLVDGDISGGVDAYIDPKQNVLASSEFECLLTFIPLAIGRKITLKVGFNNPLKQ